MDEKGIHNVVIISGGGKELGGERADIEQQVKELSAQVEYYVSSDLIALVCLTAKIGWIVHSKDMKECLRPKNGNVAFLSQSGTIGIAFMEHSSPFGMSKMISYGNRSDVDEADMIWYLSEDPQTKVIGLYVEGLGRWQKIC